MRRAVVAVLFVGLCSMVACRSTPSATTPAPSAADGSKVPEGRLPEGVRPTRYALTLAVDPSTDGFSGEATIAIDLAEETSGFWMHGQDLEVASIQARVDGRTVAATWEQRTSDGVSRVELAETLPRGQVLLDVAYEAGFDHPLRGLYKVTADGRAYAFTQFESISARLAFPCFDEPRFKTPFDLTVIAPADQFVAANTPVDTAVLLPANRQRVRFVETPPLPTYLVALTVGPLDVVPGPPIAPSELRPTTVPLRGLAAKGQGQRLSYALSRTGEQVEALERYFDIPYPYRKLDLVAVPDFGAGAMENVGLITFREWLLLVDERRAPEYQRRAFAYVLAHELAHQWFGNLVTMPWWNDIWLNESFATWMGNKVVAELHPEYQVGLAALSSAHQAMRLDSLTSARSIRQPVLDNHDIQNAFDAITYQKGGAVLEMFERWMGEDAFRNGIRRYLRKHEEGTATAEDLLRALDAVDDRDVSSPFKTFLTQPGVPLVHAELRCDGDRGRLFLRQERYFPVGSDGDRDRSWQIPMCIRQSSGSACVLLAESSGVIPLPDCPSWWMPNDEGSGYFRFSLADRDWAALRSEGFSKLSSRGRLAVADSLFAAFARASIDARTLVPWLPKLAASPIRSIATAPMDELRFMMDDGAPPESREAVTEYAATLYRQRYRSLGWRSRDGDSSDTKLLREAVVHFMVMDVRDREARRRAARFGRALVGYKNPARPNAVDAQLEGVALAAAAQRSGSGFFDHLLALVRESSDVVERNRLLSAMGHVEDPGLAERALDLTLDPAVRVNEIGRILGPQLSNPRTRKAAWAWFTDHFDELESRFGKRQFGRVPWYTTSFCSTRAAEEVEAFFAPRVAELTGGPRNLAGAVEAISLCAALVDAQRESIARAFAR